MHTGKHKLNIYTIAAMVTFCKKTSDMIKFTIVQHNCHTDALQINVMRRNDAQPERCSRYQKIEEPTAHSNT